MCQIQEGTWRLSGATCGSSSRTAAPRGAKSASGTRTPTWSAARRRRGVGPRFERTICWVSKEQMNIQRHYWLIERMTYEQIHVINTQTIFADTDSKRDIKDTSPKLGPLLCEQPSPRPAQTGRDLMAGQADDDFQNPNRQEVMYLQDGIA